MGPESRGRSAAFASSWRRGQSREGNQPSGVERHANNMQTVPTDRRCSDPAQRSSSSAYLLNDLISKTDSIKLPKMHRIFKYKNENFISAKARMKPGDYIWKAGRSKDCAWTNANTDTSRASFAQKIKIARKAICVYE